MRRFSEYLKEATSAVYDKAAQTLLFGVVEDIKTGRAVLQCHKRWVERDFDQKESDIIEMVIGEKCAFSPRRVSITIKIEES